MEGCAKWLEHGLGEPAAVMDATEAYRRSQEPLADFVADCCRLGPELSVSASRLREEYETWYKSERCWSSPRVVISNPAAVTGEHDIPRVACGASPAAVARSVGADRDPE